MRLHFGSAMVCALSFALSGCDTAVQVVTGPGGADLGVTGAGDGGASGLLCEVATFLSDRCVSCHGTPVAGGATMSLASRADLVKPSYVIASQTFAERALARMQDAQRPMPPAPAPRATTSEITALSSWISAGMPDGNCMLNDPFNAPPQCTSATYWTDGNNGSRDMRPGVACISCHATSPDPPPLLIAGTVFPTAHEPDDCVGGINPPNLSAATVRLTGHDGKVIDVPVRPSGNFFLLSDNNTLAFPFSARLLWQGRERIMNTPQSSGDCNGCHTQSGASGGRGRILLP